MQNKHFCFLACLVLSVVFITQAVVASQQQEVVLVTVLYNEAHAQRRDEYIACFAKNCEHPFIDKIHVVYDTSKDDDQNILLEYLKKQPCVISYVHGRPSFQDCFTLVNACYPSSIVVLSNADIYFNHTLELLAGYNFDNKFFAITRWDEQEDGSLLLFRQYKADGSFDEFASELSQDVWIFKAPIKDFIRADFKLGTWACDGYIACQAWLSGLEVINPCLSIQCCHVHRSKVRHWIPQSIPGVKALRIPWQHIG
jgi:hypothetical protein